jgi:alkylation response protein AidB-like acyl-CoA dehydrogenase
LQKPRESAEDVTQDEYASVEIEELAELLMAIRERRRFAPLQRIRSGLTRLKQAFPKAGFLAAVLPVRWRGRMVASLQYAGALSLIAFACLVGYVAGRDTGRVMFLAKFETPGDAGETSLLLEDGDNL